MAKMAEDATHLNFRDRARQVYEERRAEGRLGAFAVLNETFLMYLTNECLGPAQRTCVTLDEKAQKTVRMLRLHHVTPLFRTIV